MSQIGFLVDTRRCIGCHACRVACQVHRATGPEVNWRQVTAHEAGTFPDVVQHNLSVACNHCERPACLPACPTAAIRKRDADGIVFIDPERCTGCGHCLAACPYGALHRTPGAAAVSKCDFCMTRQDRGLAPVCVETCVGGALQFGPLDELARSARGRTLRRRVRGFFDPDQTRPAIRFLTDDVR